MRPLRISLALLLANSLSGLLIDSNRFQQIPVDLNRFRWISIVASVSFGTTKSVLPNRFQSRQISMDFNEFAPDLIKPSIKIVYSDRMRRLDERGSWNPKSQHTSRLEVPLVSLSWKHLREVHFEVLLEVLFRGSLQRFSWKLLLETSLRMRSKSQSGPAKWLLNHPPLHWAPSGQPLSFASKRIRGALEKNRASSIEARSIHKSSIDNGIRFVIDWLVTDQSLD